jgi:hypothetical protein
MVIIYMTLLNNGNVPSTKEFWKTLYSAIPSPQLVGEKVPVGRMRGVLV